MHFLPNRVARENTGASNRSHWYSRPGRWLVALLAGPALLLAGCEGSGGTEAGAVNLGIADRAWAPGHEDVGWCGETCIQMALAYYGREETQTAINAAAGSPTDITEDDMDRALRTLGVAYEAWDAANSDVGHFIGWVKAHVNSGHPVICGTKYYPDEAPEWYVDHFALAVGYDDASLILNTQANCDGQIAVSDAQLASQSDGYAFANRYQRYFGRAITGVR